MYGVESTALLCELVSFLCKSAHDPTTDVRACTCDAIPPTNLIRLPSSHPPPTLSAGLYQACSRSFRLLLLWPAFIIPSSSCSLFYLSLALPSPPVSHLPSAKHLLFYDRNILTIK